MDGVKKSSMTSPHTADKYKCNICKDVGWVQNGDGTWSRCKCYEKECIERLWANFGVKVADVKKLNEYKPYDDRTAQAKNKAIQYLRTFDKIINTNENSFGLFGQAGSGKTHIIVAIGAALLRREKDPVPVVYMPYLEAIRELKANSMDDEYYAKLSGRYCTAKVLIIDDLFKDKIKNGKLMQDKYGHNVALNEADMKHIYPILNYRYINHLPTLISTECTPQTLMELDEALAGRILERCGSNMVVFQGEEYNFRMRKFVEAAANTEVS
jgi:DNA replication protein DnaC